MTSAVTPEAASPERAPEEASNDKCTIIQHGGITSTSNGSCNEVLIDADASVSKKSSALDTHNSKNEKSSSSSSKHIMGESSNVKINASNGNMTSNGSHHKSPLQQNSDIKKNKSTSGSGTKKIEGNGSKMTGEAKSNEKKTKQSSPPAKPPANVQTITITAEDVTSSVVSVVDPWVPRIRNNDEYLQRGLDFSPKIIVSKSKSKSKSKSELINEKYLQRGLDAIKNEEKEEEKEEEKCPEDGIINEASENENNSNNNNVNVINNINPQIPSSLVGDVGATRLSEALLHNTHLLHLNLSRNDIGIEGGVSLAKCLYSQITTNSKTVLRAINLSHNRILSEGAMAFGLALRFNSSLKEIKLADCGIGLEGVLALLEGLERNKEVKRMVLVDNYDVRNLSSKDMTKVVESVAKVLREGRNGMMRKGHNGESALEVLEMHCNTSTPHHSDGKGKDVRDNFDKMSEDDAWALVCSMYVDRNDNIKLRNHRFRTLTLPGGERIGNEGGEGGHDNDDNDDDDDDGGIKKKEKLPVHKLRRILRFNSFFRPIVQLYDVINSPLAQAEDVLGVTMKLPRHLKRDVRSGALVALLPSSSASSSSSSNSKSITTRTSSSSSSGGGMECKLMPGVLAFACSECTLDTIWNVIRYRPDIFCFAVAGASTSTVVSEVGCAPGCCIS